VIFPDFATANSVTMTPDMFTVDDRSPANAYDIVKNNNMPTAFAAIELLDSQWTEPNMEFKIGSGDTSQNAPLQTGFYYRVFIRSFSSDSRRNAEQQSSSSDFSDVFVNPTCKYNA